MSDFVTYGNVLLKYTGTDESVIIPSGVEEIGEKAFSNCRFLKRVTLPDTVRKIGIEAFNSCTKLTDVFIGEGVEQICSGAFYYCTSLKNITLPQTFQMIGGSAFARCKSLESMVIPQNVICVFTSAFREATALKTVTFTGSTAIEDDVFYGCTSLETVHLAQGVPSIGERAFEFCSSLRCIHIPSSVREIGKDAFGGCAALKELDFEDTAPMLQGVFGRQFPMSLFSKRETLVPMFGDEDLVKLVIQTKLWTSLSPELKCQLMWTRPQFKVRAAAAERLGQSDYTKFCAFLSEKLNAELSKKDCETVWQYLKTFAAKRELSPLADLYVRLRLQKNAADLPPLDMLFE